MQRNADRIYKQEKGRESLCIQNILDGMSVPRRAPRIMKKIGKANLGVKHGRPVHPGSAKTFGGADDFFEPAVTAISHADPVTGAFPDTQLWDGGTEAASSRAYRTLTNACLARGFPPPPPFKEMEGLKYRGFESVNLDRDDHVVVAYLLVRFSKKNPPSFSWIRSLVNAHRSKAAVLVPHTLSASGVKSIFDDARHDLKKESSCESYETEVEDGAERICRVQEFARSADAAALDRMVDASRKYAVLLKKATPIGSSVLPKTLSKIAVLLMVTREGLSSNAINPSDKPYVSRKMRPIVKEVSLRGID